jgi:glycosyltransferase involved in cell wall biosynthesis
MRIAFFTETFLPKVDGIVNTLCHLLEHLATRGHTSLLFAPNGGPTRFAATQVVGLQGVAIPFYRELRLVHPFTDVREPLSAFRPDLIHVINPVSLGLAGIWQARQMKKPVVASYHTDVPGFAARWGLGLLRPALWAYFRAVHNQANLNLCPSEFTQREIESHGLRRVKVWGRGVNTQHFHPARRMMEWRNRLSGGETGSPLLLYVGRLSPEKRVDWLRPVLTALPEVRLAIIGDGPQRPALEQMFRFAGSRTVFAGYLYGDDLAHAYAAADVFVFPAANETLGNVVLEAMASGLPVVAPHSGGLLDHVVHGKTGLLFPPDEAEGLTSAVKKLVSNPAWARALGEAGRAHVEGQSWDSVFDNLLVDYERAIHKYHRREQARARILKSGRPRSSLTPG